MMKHSQQENLGWRHADLASQRAHGAVVDFVRKETDRIIGEIGLSHMDK